MARLKAPQCSSCSGSNIKIRRQIAKNGSEQFGWYCLTCEWWAENPTKWLLRDKVKELAAYHKTTLGDVETIVDYSSGITCRVCGKQGAEDHHWAPKALREQFGDDWALWERIQDPLCIQHHLQWHSIVTPELRRVATEDTWAKR